MFCGECGTANPDTNHFCKNCGSSLKKRPDAVPGATAPLQPVRQQASPAGAVQPLVDFQPAAAMAQPPAAVSPVKPKRSWTGIGSLGFGILSWLFLPYLLGTLAVILGAVSLFRTRKGSGKISIIAITGIIIASGAMLVNYFYIFIF